MKIKELIEMLEKASDKEKVVVVSIYQDNDSGEQDIYDISCVVEYPDGHMQVKT